jgi:hypothetical protein
VVEAGFEQEVGTRSFDDAQRAGADAGLHRGDAVLDGGAALLHGEAGAAQLGDVAGAARVGVEVTRRGKCVA